jgi:hypothetical protein
MNNLSPITRRALMASASALALLLAPVVARGGPSDGTSIVVTPDPATASVSRQGGPTFYVSYKVTVGNNSSNNTLTYDFKGSTEVLVLGTNGKWTAISNTSEYVGSSGIPCTKVTGSMTEVTCAKLSVDKGTSKSFVLTYKTPLKADALNNGGRLRLTVESTSRAIKGAGSGDAILVTQPITDINLGFETFVTETGGLFYSGFVGQGCGSIPGSWPSATDPFTTTLFVPPINFTTTAKVYETPPNGQSCSPLYTADGCFQSDLKIPSAPAAFDSLKIYLRIGPNKITPGASIANAVLKYSKDSSSPEIDLQSCSQTGGPTSGNPCIASRRAYGTNYPVPSPSSCGGVWEFLVEAVDNGLYRIR